MRRRTLLATLGTMATGAVAGCTGGSNDGSGSDDSGGSGSTDAPATEPEMGDATLSRVGDCEQGSAGTATVSFGEAAVDVEGCLIARNGCHYPALADAGYADGEFRLVVEEVDESEPDDMCTEALEYRAYEAEVTFDDGTPETVAVVHDTAQGRQTVTTASRG